MKPIRDVVGKSLDERFGIKVGRTAIAVIKRRSQDGTSVVCSFSLTLRDKDGARAGQFELPKDVAAELARQITGAVPRETIDDK